MKWNELLKKRATLGHLLRVREVAKLLGVTRQHIYNLLKAGEIPGVFRLSIHGTRICSASLLEWSKEKMLEQNPEATEGKSAEQSRDATEDES